MSEKELEELFTLLVDLSDKVSVDSIGEVKQGFRDIFPLLNDRERRYWILETSRIRSIDKLWGFGGQEESLKNNLFEWLENILPDRKITSASYLDATDFRKIAHQGNKLSRTLLVTPGCYENDHKAAASVKCFAENGKLTVLYIGEKDPNPKDNSAIFQMSEFAEVKCLPGYSRKQGDIEEFMVEYAKNIVEEEKGLRGKND